MLVSDVTINSYSTLNEDPIFINNYLSKDIINRNIDDKTYYYLLTNIKVENFSCETDFLHKNFEIRPFRFNLSDNNLDIFETTNNIFGKTKRLEAEFVEVLKFTSNRIAKNTTNLKRL